MDLQTPLLSQTRRKRTLSRSSSIGRHSTVATVALTGGDHPNNHHPNNPSERRSFYSQREPKLPPSSTSRSNQKQNNHHNIFFLTRDSSSKDNRENPTPSKARVSRAQAHESEGSENKPGHIGSSGSVRRTLGFTHDEADITEEGRGGFRPERDVTTCTDINNTDHTSANNPISNNNNKWNNTGGTGMRDSSSYKNIDNVNISPKHQLHEGSENSDDEEDEGSDNSDSMSQSREQLGSGVLSIPVRLS